MRKRLQITVSFLLLCSSLFAQPRWFWSQLPAADTPGSIAIALPNGDGIWSDSLRWWQGQLRIAADTAATRAYARDINTNMANTNLSFSADRAYALGGYNISYNTSSLSNVFHIDATNNKIGLGTGSPVGSIHQEFQGLGSDEIDFFSPNMGSNTYKTFYFGKNKSTYNSSFIYHRQVSNGSNNNALYLGMFGTGNGNVRIKGTGEVVVSNSDIEYEDGSGNNTLQVVTSGASPGSGGLSVINQASTVYAGGIKMLAPNLTPGQSIGMAVGKSASINNWGGWSFWFNGDNSINNSMSFGFFGQDSLLTIQANRLIRFESTSAIRVPVGNNSQKGSGSDGHFRFDTDDSEFMGHDGNEWKNFAWHNGSTLNVGNYSFNIDQSVGTGQDDYIQGYNDSSGEIELRPSALSTRGQLVEIASESMSTGATFTRFTGLSSQNLSNFTATDSTLTYTGIEDVLVEISYSGNIYFDVSSAGTYRAVVKPYVNGGFYNEAISDIQISTDGAEDWLQHISGTTWATLSTNDVISLRYTATAGGTYSLFYLSLTVKAL